MNVKLKQFFCILFILSISILCLHPPVSAADLEYRVTHNDQDALVLGIVTHIENNTFLIDVSYNVVSTAGLMYKDDNVMFPEIVAVQNKHNRTYGIQKGAMVLASLLLEEGQYYIKWGMWHVSGFEPGKIKVFTQNGSIYKELTDFLNDGTILEVIPENLTLSKVFAYEKNKSSAFLFPKGLAPVAEKKIDKKTEIRILSFLCLIAFLLLGCSILFFSLYISYQKYPHNVKDTT